MKNKRTLILFIIAVALCVALVVGATTMLFTWQSGTAENKLETGNVHITLWEKDSDSAYDADTDIIAQGGRAIAFDSEHGNGEFYPGCEIPKYTKVVNDGHGDAFLRMHVEISLGDDNSPHTYCWPDTDPDHSTDIVTALLYYLDHDYKDLGGSVFGSNFFGIPGASKTGPNGEIILTCDFYYVNTVDADSNLKPLLGEAANPGGEAIFLEGIQLPLFAYFDGTDISFTDDAKEDTDLVPLGNYMEVYDYLYDMGIVISISAQAVQVAHNPYVSGGISSWPNAFAGDSWTNQQ